MCRTYACTGAWQRRGRPSKAFCWQCPGSMRTRALLYRVYVVLVLLYALPETSGLTDQQLQPLVSARNAYLRRVTGMGRRHLHAAAQMRASAGCLSACPNSTRRGEAHAPRTCGQVT